MEILGSGTIFGQMAKMGSGYIFRVTAHCVLMLSLVVCLTVAVTLPLKTVNRHTETPARKV